MCGGSGRKVGEGEEVGILISIFFKVINNNSNNRKIKNRKGKEKIINKSHKHEKRIDIGHHFY